MAIKKRSGYKERDPVKAALEAIWEKPGLSDLPLADDDMFVVVTSHAPLLNEELAVLGVFESKDEAVKYTSNGADVLAHFLVVPVRWPKDAEED